MKHDETRSFSARESIRFPHVFGALYRRAAFRLQPSLRWEVPFVFGAKVFSKRIGFQPHQMGVSENSVSHLPNGFHDHYPYEKWLAIIGKINPTFSGPNPDLPDFSWDFHRQVDHFHLTNRVFCNYDVSLKTWSFFSDRPIELADRLNGYLIKEYIKQYRFDANGYNMTSYIYI